MPRAARAFYAKDPESLARALLGQRLVRITPDATRLAGTIVEVEAYLGHEDKAAHSFGGRRTARNESMYARPGTLYVYFTYGMHHCMNVVCGREDEPVAVLIRALEPVEGLGAMRSNRAARRDSDKPIRDTDLCSGPAKICQALGIDLAQDGLDLTTSDSLFIERIRSRALPEHLLVRTPRIGVTYAGEWAHRPLRFVVRGNPHASGPRGRPAASADSRTSRAARR